MSKRACEDAWFDLSRVAYEPFDVPVIPKFSGWHFMVTDEGLSICPVYGGQFGCRLWHFETLGM